MRVLWLCGLLAFCCAADAGETASPGSDGCWPRTSGWSIFPHLHNELTRSADMMQEGLPAAFHGFRRVLGSKAVALRSGAVDSGDIVESGLR